MVPQKFGGAIDIFINGGIGVINLITVLWIFTNRTCHIKITATKTARIALINRHREASGVNQTVKFRKNRTKQALRWGQNEPMGLGIRMGGTQMNIFHV